MNAKLSGPEVKSGGYGPTPSAKVIPEIESRFTISLIITVREFESIEGEIFIYMGVGVSCWYHAH